MAIATKPCGIDVERYDRNFERVKSRYMTAEEQSLSVDDHWAAVVWCAKEAMYKLYGRKGVDLINDLSVTSYDAYEGCIYGSMRGLRGAKVELSTFDEDMIVAVATYI